MSLWRQRMIPIEKIDAITATALAAKEDLRERREGERKPASAQAGMPDRPLGSEQLVNFGQDLVDPLLDAGVGLVILVGIVEG